MHLCSLYSLFFVIYISYSEQKGIRIMPKTWRRRKIAGQDVRGCLAFLLYSLCPEGDWRGNWIVLCKSQEAERNEMRLTIDFLWMQRRTCSCRCSPYSFLEGETSLLLLRFSSNGILSHPENHEDVCIWDAVCFFSEKEMVRCTHIPDSYASNLYVLTPDEFTADLTHE